MIEKICDYCKKPFEVPNYKKDKARFCSRTCGGRKHKQQFCSNQCRINAIKSGMIQRHYSEEGIRNISQARKGKIGWNRGKNTRVQIICEICKKTFEVDNYRKDKARFCSLACFGKAKRKLANIRRVAWNKGISPSTETKAKISKKLIGRRYNKNIQIITCEVCNKQFQVKKYRKDNARFCSNKCRGVWISKNIFGDKVYNYKEKIEKKCPECDKIFYMYPYREKQGAQFCTIRCYGVWQSRNKTGKNSPSWIDGRSYYPYCHKFNERLKEKVRDRDNRTCQLCGNKENGSKLPVHHVHYDKENCYPDLISLCRKCNSKVNKISERKHYENVFMNKLNDKGLLFWVKQNNK